jgi:hypothetical protein
VFSENVPALIAFNTRSSTFPKVKSMKTAAFTDIATESDQSNSSPTPDVSSETQRAGHLSPAPEQQKLDEARDVAAQDG